MLSDDLFSKYALDPILFKKACVHYNLLKVDDDEIEMSRDALVIANNLI